MENKYYSGYEDLWFKYDEVKNKFEKLLAYVALY